MIRASRGFCVKSKQNYVGVAGLRRAYKDAKARGDTEEVETIAKFAAELKRLGLWPDAVDNLSRM
jgi:hypothetical protein